MMLLTLTGCFGSGGSGGAGPAQDTDRATAGRRSDAARQYPLDSLPTAVIQLKGQDVQVWLAQEFDAQRPHAVEEGLMHVPPEEIGARRACCSSSRGAAPRILDAEHHHAARHRLRPLGRHGRQNLANAAATLRTFSSIEPAMFALEMKKAFALGLQEGDRLTIPDAVFKTQP